MLCFFIHCYSHVSANRMQSDESLLSRAMLRCSLTWRSNVSANRMQSDESWLSKAMLRCSLTSRMQRYNLNPPKSKFFGLLISHLESFPHPKIGIQPFIYGHSSAFSTRKKKWNRDITFYFLPIHKTYEAATFGLPKMLLPSHTFLLLSHDLKS